jgi:hypothetical protein
MSAQHEKFMWVQLCVTRPSRYEPNFEPDIFRMEAQDRAWAITQHGHGPRYCYSLWKRLSLMDIQVRALSYGTSSGKYYFLRHLHTRPLGNIIRISV